MVWAIAWGYPVRLANLPELWKLRKDVHGMNHLSFRTRLIVWYLAALVGLLLIFAASLYWQTQRSLLDQTDDVLQLAINQAETSVTITDGNLHFAEGEALNTLLDTLDDEFVIQIVKDDGTVYQRLAKENEDIPILEPREQEETRLIGFERWRVVSQPLIIDGSQVGWVQAMQAIDQLEDVLDDLLRQMLISFSVVLLLAGLGGYWLATQALAPIQTITQTAEQISTSDLSSRIGYEGPEDEIGQLAGVLDAMLARLEEGFVRERRFTADAAHELRTPLTALKGHIEVTLSRQRTPEEYSESLHGLLTEVDRLIRLSSDLLFMARIDQGVLQLASEKASLDEFVGGLTDFLAPLAQEKGVEIAVDIPAGSTIQGNTDLLIRLFLNVLENGVKYSPAGRTLTLTAQQNRETLAITISDTGPGIPPEHLPHLFKRFYRADQSRHRASGGSGLGLAIAHEIVQVHKGTISVESTIGQGTTFHISLPNNK